MRDGVAPRTRQEREPRGVPLVGCAAHRPRAQALARTQIRALSAFRRIALRYYVLFRFFGKTLISRLYSLHIHSHLEPIRLRFVREF